MADTHDSQHTQVTLSKLLSEVARYLAPLTLTTRQLISSSGNYCYPSHCGLDVNTLLRH